MCIENYYLLIYISDDNSSCYIMTEGWWIDRLICEVVVVVVCIELTIKFHCSVWSLVHLLAIYLGRQL